MSVTKLANTLRMMSNMASQGMMATAIGSVNAFDPSGYQVQVLLQAQTSDGPALQTGWIPLATPWAGNGWGMFAPASPGDLILVFFQDGSLQNPIAGMRLFFNGQQPLNVSSGEMQLVHQSGSAFKFNNDGSVELIANTELNLNAPTVNINASSACNINCPSITAGPTGGTFEPLLNALSVPTLNIKAT